MTDSSEEILKVLNTIRDLLEPISACFEDDYREASIRKQEAKIKQFQELLTPTRRRIYPLLFDHRRLSQEAIAEEAGTSQPTVSRFVAKLLETGLIREASDREGNPVYEDAFDLRRIAEEIDDQD